LLTTGGYIQKIHSSALVLMGIVFTLAILFGPVFCGWVCPLGSVQEWVGKLGRRLLGKRYNEIVPSKLDRVLRYLRYVVLGLVLYNTAVSGLLLFSNVDPYYALYHFWTGETAVASLVVLAVTLLLSLVVERPWCKYACPYGALLGLTNFIRIFKIRRQVSTCIDCGSCDRACPMNIAVSMHENVLDHQCISCMQCTSQVSCPVENTVGLLSAMPKRIEGEKNEKSAKPVGFVTIAVLIFVIMFGGIASTAALGYWSTSSEKIPAKFEKGVAEGSYDPSDIRGSYTFMEVATIFEIDPEVLREAFQIPSSEDLNTYQSKNLETQYAGSAQEIGNSSLQVFVALYKNLPITLADVYLPESAVVLIESHNAALTAEQKTYLELHSVGTQGVVSPKSETTEVVATAEEAEINGQTTFKAVLDLGITEAQIESVINAKMPPTNVTVRGYCQENGLSFSEVKEKLSAFLAE
jgi:ferredoxin